MSIHPSVGHPLEIEHLNHNIIKLWGGVGDVAGKKKKQKAKARLEEIIKHADGVAPTLMMRGNYGRLMLKKKIAEKLADAMPTQVNFVFIQSYF